MKVNIKNPSFFKCPVMIANDELDFQWWVLQLSTVELYPLYNTFVKLIFGLDWTLLVIENSLSKQRLAFLISVVIISYIEWYLCLCCFHLYYLSQLLFVAKIILILDPLTVLWIFGGDFLRSFRINNPNSSTFLFLMIF